MAIHFIENPENLPVVMHMDDNRANNHVSNLRWGTHKDNVNDAFRKGRMKGQYSNFTKEQVIDIRRKYSPFKYTRRMLAEEYGVTHAIISSIVDKITYYPL